MEAVLRIHEQIRELKRIARTGWLERGVGDPESVADHSFAVALLAAILAESRGMDVLEAVFMALIHDLPEAATGDLTPEMKGEGDAGELEEEERRFIEDLAKLLPERAASRLLDSWLRYRRCGDDVARLVRDVDKLEMGLQALAYAREGYAGAWEIYQSALNEIRDGELRRILEAAARALT